MTALHKITNMCLFILLCAVMTGTAGAQESGESSLGTGAGCPHAKPARINIYEYTGDVYQQQERNAFDIARFKHQRYGQKMPYKQGNVGEVVFRPETRVDIKTFGNMGCFYIEEIDVKIFVDHKIEIANDFAEGSCMHNELYNLEIELMQQDEEIINEDIALFRETIKDLVGTHNVFGPVSGANMNKAVIEKREEVKNMVRNRLEALGETLFETRRESDSPDIYGEIEQDCMAGQ